MLVRFQLTLPTSEPPLASFPLEGHNQSREELSKGLQSCLSQDSEACKPGGNHTTHQPATLSQKIQEKGGFILFGLFCFAQICQPALPSAPAPSTVPPSHAATCLI